MTIDNASGQPPRRPQRQHVLLRVDVLAGLMFMAVAGVGLAVSWDYPVGTATRMGTGYVPRLFLWILLGLGALIVITGWRSKEPEERAGALDWRPIVFIPLALFVFAMTVERIGFFAGGLLTVIVAGFASRDSRVIEVLISAIALVLFVWVIFIWALGLTFPIWPGD